MAQLRHLGRSLSSSSKAAFEVLKVVSACSNWENRPQSKHASLMSQSARSEGVLKMMEALGCGAYSKLEVSLDLREKIA